jgi:hypothetical protein
MSNDKKLIDKVAEGLRSAGQAVAEAITPKPIRAGDKMIIPSTDPSMPPVVIPVRKRTRRSASRKTANAHGDEARPKHRAQDQGREAAGHAQASAEDSGKAAAQDRASLRRFHSFSLVSGHSRSSKGYGQARA